MINIQSNKAYKIDQKGFLLIEILVGLSIISVLGLGITYSMWTSYRVDLVSKRNYNALHLAHQKIESVSLIDPQTLDSSDNSSELVSEDGVAYLRTTNIVVQPSKVRRVKVTVRTINNSSQGGKAELEAAFALWGRR